MHTAEIRIKGQIVEKLTGLLSRDKGAGEKLTGNRDDLRWDLTDELVP